MKSDEHQGESARRPGSFDENSRMSAPASISGKFDYKQTTGWLRDLLKYPKTYTPKLTEMPQKTQYRISSRNNSRAGIGLSGNVVSEERRGRIPNRSLTRESTWSGRTVHTLDNRFKNAVSHLENLLNEALVLANQVAEREDQRRDGKCDHLQLDQGTMDFAELDLSQIYGDDDKYRVPSVHESVTSLARSSVGRLRDGGHADRALLGRLEQQRAEKADVRDGHPPPTPGMHSGNVIITVPERYSSLKTSRLSEVSLDDKKPPMPSGDNNNKDHEDHPKHIFAPYSGPVPNSHEICEFVKSFHKLPIQQRDSSQHHKEKAPHKKCHMSRDFKKKEPDSCSLDGISDDYIDFSTQYNIQPVDGSGNSVQRRVPRSQSAPADAEEGALPLQDLAGRALNVGHGINLRGRSHVSLRGYQGFSLARSHRRQPIARDWSPMRKRFVAAVACISTALIGILIGIYAGLVPSIQYQIGDFNHYTILGNVGFYLGMAIPTFFFWPLPLLHGRKPYILASLVVAMPLLFPQAISVSVTRSPYISTWRWALLGSRAFMGFTLGFASLNFHSTLTDLFGASLMSGNPHQEVVDKFDVRRHGGGMGVWLGIWTWCFIGSLGVGFLIGAAVINSLNPSWGFYISIILIAVVLLLNVLCPEVRRSAFRRSVAEIRTGHDISRRVARGEVMMHRVKDGPKWWGEEVYHGVLLSLSMLRQPGFAVIAVYQGWIYAQVVLIIVLLGSLTSQYYLLKSPLVGLCVSFVAIGALVGVPFQKANIFSRARHHQDGSNASTFRRVSWTSHLIRRTIFTIILPLAGIVYTVTSSGPPTTVVLPVLFAAAVGNLSCLAISECNGLIMETFDCSDLQPGMTGRPRGSSHKSPKRTNYSSFPRVSSGFAASHTIGFVFAAGATGIGGMAQRNLGQQAATGVVAGILFILTMLLLGVLIRFKEVQIVPTSKTIEMDKWIDARKELSRRRSLTSKKPAQKVEEEPEPWRPLIIGNPSSKMRRANILELGSMTRWTEIRKKNRLIDEGVHLNRAALDMARDAVEEATGIGALASELARRASQRSMRRYHSGSPIPGEKVAAADITMPSNVGDETQGTETGSRVPYHGQTPGAGEGFSERECVMGQTLVEEEERSGSEIEMGEIVSEHAGGVPDDGYPYDSWMARDHAAHMTNKVQNANLEE